MSGHNSRIRTMVLLMMLLAVAAPALAQDESEIPDTKHRPTHGESAARHDTSARQVSEIEAAIPPGMTLEEVFDFAESPPPADFPAPVPDDRLYVFTMFEQMEYRIAIDGGSTDHLGWEAQGWIGGDFHKLWWKNEGEAIFDGPDEGEMETDLVYSRLITPFWDVQIGVSYANGWHGSNYDDRWSGVIALQGLAPYKFELDNSLYISEHGNLTYAFEAEYDIRVSQRLVMQPRTEMGIAFQDIPGRGVGGGLTDITLDLRLRYEIKREFAPYFGIRSRHLLGKTGSIAEAGGEDSAALLILGGIRFAF